MNLGVVIQHHPARAHLLPALMAALGECEVVTDPEPNGSRMPIRTYVACLHAIPDWADYLLICQDDATPSPGWREKAEQAISERPDALIALFLAGAPHKSATLARLAYKRGEGLVKLRHDDWTPTVATVWPRTRIEEFFRWREDGPIPASMGDDNHVGEFTTRYGVPVFATIPSLIQHMNIEPSLVGKPAGAGLKLRTAVVPPS